MSRQPLTALVLLLTMSSMTVAAEGIDYARDVRPILERHCYACHAGDEQEGGLRLDIHGRVLRGGDAYGPSIVPGQPDESPLIQFISREDADLAMPPDGERLSAEEVATLSRWIELGADWPAGLDPVEDDGRDHWSFQPLVDTPLPEVLDDAWPRGDLDRFVLARLEQAGLYPAPEADSVTWLRRVSLDLTGLPPTPEQVESFLADTSGDACERVVDELLASPRYGERWAQHWLDVVRYADTHGFEVNTERPHAWPYRDYVIEALNADTPYDQFIREQIVGDSRGKDAATGFLVTASVLLPGQIGKDEPSKRLARQDSLDEIVVNIGQTFLGLTVGCARCHHHKFDPISQHDYYAMQAFVAGVEYGDREWRTPATEARQRESESLREQIAKIDQKLAHFVPLARLDDGPPQTTSPQLNSEQFDPIPAKFVRFTIHDANRHPSLGLIEPCLDEFEIFEAPPSTSANGVTSDARNVALASHGTKVTASGSNTSDRHKLEHINDGQYGNSRSWMADQRGQGWVLFELPEPTLISRVDWSRDRNGKFTDRLATAYTLEAGESVDAMTRLAHVPPARPAVNSRHNTDRFAPTTTRRLRFTILATSSLEPCLDEIEILNRDGVNVALATHGSTVRSSGNYDSPGVHELRFVHDGEYGNSRSWISSEIGGGWVEIEFPQDETIDRVIWGRDRDGKFTDRLPTEYRIEVWNTEGDWESVAASTDRAPFDSDVNADMEPSFAALPEDEAQEATRLQADRQRLERRLEVASQAMQVFAGTFRSPDEIHVLRRGDPEQPQDRVNPAVPELLGTLSLPTDAPEQLRRTALADWIADPHHPLTTRVMVNRLWQGHFGVGLVDTPNDFGRNGSQPTHPELLDWLAARFVDSGWSFKAMHRMLVLSSTYRQSTQLNADAMAIDADARLLWRYPPRRLDGETIRDCMLTVSGQLNLQMGGRGYDLFDKRGGLTGFTPVESFQGDGLRRMIYAHKVRRERDAVFGAFDCPDAGQSSPRRRESTTPIQALNLFNSRFTLDQSQALADRVIRTAGADVDEQIRWTYRLALCREPTASETADAFAAVQEFGLPVLCRVLFNSNEFLFIP